MINASEITERVADILDMAKLEMPKETYKAVEAALSDWGDEVRQEGRDAGHEEGYAEALKDERVADDKTMDDLQTGIDLLQKGDACASTYLDRALRDLGSSYY